jgi:outer membrane protein assembly factor BamE (lipoprotein component of BamABCDE complex)
MAIKALEDLGKMLAHLGGMMGKFGLRMAFIVLALAACTPLYQRHGYVPEVADLDRIELGKDTRETVAAIVGRPSTAGLLNDVGWFYVQSKWKQVGAMAPVEIDRQVVAITFDESGTVANVERFGLEKGTVVALSRRVTEPNVKSAGFLRQLFGNIGRISTDQLLSQ